MIDEASHAEVANDAGATGTGDARVDAAIGGLSELDALPVSDHIERYADVHSQLQDILNEVGNPAPPVDQGR